VRPTGKNPAHYGLALCMQEFRIALHCDDLPEAGLMR